MFLKKLHSYKVKALNRCHVSTLLTLQRFTTLAGKTTHGQWFLRQHYLDQVRGSAALARPPSQPVGVKSHAGGLPDDC
jgi:hypothetical protein